MGEFSYEREHLGGVYLHVSFLMDENIIKGEFPYRWEHSERLLSGSKYSRRPFLSVSSGDNIPGRDHQNSQTRE